MLPLHPHDAALQWRWRSVCPVPSSAWRSSDWCCGASPAANRYRRRSVPWRSAVPPPSSPSPWRASAPGRPGGCPRSGLRPHSWWPTAAPYSVTVWFARAVQTRNLYVTPGIGWISGGKFARFCEKVARPVVAVGCGIVSQIENAARAIGHVRFRGVRRIAVEEQHVARIGRHRHEIEMLHLRHRQRAPFLTGELGQPRTVAHFEATILIVARSIVTSAVTNMLA